jgi:hypothetical protein
LIGGYHFARPEVDLGTTGADAEAAYFWSVASNYIIADGLSLMPVLDYETEPGSSYTQTTSSQWVNEWCQDIVNYALSNGVIVTPVVYSGGSFAATWLNSTVTQWPLWVYGSDDLNPQTGTPATTPWSTWSFWQYGQGTNPGITNGDVDEDVFNGTAATLTNYVAGTATTTTLHSFATSAYGGLVFFTATVAPAPSGGTVQFYTNGAALGGPLDASGGTVSYFTSLLGAGSYSITAAYSGAVGFGPSSTTNAPAQLINPAPLTVTPTAQSKRYGQTLTFGGGSTQFTCSGLRNDETAGTATLTDTGNGGVSNAPVGTYPITPSLLTGGTFNPSNYNITYNTGTLTVTLPSNTIPVTIVGVDLLGDRAVRLNFTGTPGYVYLIEAATNLNPPIRWTILSTNAAAADGVFSLTDTNAVNYTGRYYRTAVQ